MVIKTIQDAIDHIAATEEIYELEEREIRGVTYRTFKNGPKSLRDVHEMCLQHGDADFLVYDDERYSFNDVHGLTLKLAGMLVDVYGVKQGDKVALLMRNVPEYPVLFLALASIGAVTVFLNSWWTTAELEYGFGDCDVKLAFVDEPRSTSMEPFADRLGIKRVVVRTSETEKIPAFWDMLAQRSDAGLPAVTIDPDDDLAVMYTSGSAGYPKGVVLTHRGAISSLQSWLFGIRISELLGYAPATTVDSDGKPYQACAILTTPFFHVSGTHAGFLLGIWSGQKLVILHKWDPRRTVELIEQEKVSRFGGVPTMSAELIEAATAMGCTLDSLRIIDAGGAKRPPAQVRLLAELLPHAMPGNGFGMTETNGLGIGLRGQAYVDQPEATGRLQQPLQDMRLVDDNDHDVPVGEVGELVLKSAANMRCYLNQEEETAKVLRDGWLYTGDLAHIDEHGIITLVDRKKDMIIRGGENISCTEVQASLYLHPGVAEAAVFSIPDERLGEAVGACVQLGPGASVTEEKLKYFLKSRIAAFKVPKKIWFRDSPLPRGATEKIDRLALRAECLGTEPRSTLFDGQT